MEWLTTKNYRRLTKEEAEKELTHLLLNCESEEEFLQECRHRFGGPMVNVRWGALSRVASICFSQNGSNLSVRLFVDIQPDFIDREGEVISA